MADITMTRNQYEVLLAAAETSAADADAVALVKKAVDTTNSLTRYVLWARYQDVGGVAPVLISGEGYPPLTRVEIKQDRAISREDVLASITSNGAVNPADIHVTPDRHGEIGWTLLDTFFG